MQEPDCAGKEWYKPLLENQPCVPDWISLHLGELLKKLSVSLHCLPSRSCRTFTMFNCPQNSAPGYVGSKICWWEIKICIVGETVAQMRSREVVCHGRKSREVFTWVLRNGRECSRNWKGHWAILGSVGAQVKLYHLDSGFLWKCLAVRLEAGENLQLD